mgnify:CR=1 FL=1
MDVDIDVKERSEMLIGLAYIPASIIVNEELVKHPTGVHFQNVPVDPITGLCSFPNGSESNDFAGELGLLKIDIIPNHSYQYVESKEHLDEILEREVDWSLFLREDVVNKLHQIGNHFDIVDAYEPKSIEDLAILIAIIRPAKRYLLGEPWEVIREQIWSKGGEEYAYKKSHAVAFAMAIVVQLQSMIEAGIITV